MRSSGRHPLLAAAAVLAAAGASLGGGVFTGMDAPSGPQASAADAAPVKQQPATRGQRSAADQADLLRMLGWGSLRPARYPRRTPSWTHASYRRAALKARNKAKSRGRK